jgi:hypothetical protein
MSLSQLASSAGPVSAGPFEPFDLIVHLGPNAVPWLSAASRAGLVHGVPRHGVSMPQLSELLDRVHDYTDAVQFAEPQPDPELSRILGELVFGDPMVLQLFQATRGVAADHGQQLLVRVLASPHLAVLPWELLPDPAAVHSGRGHRYLALAPDTHMVRMARGRTYPVRGDLLEAPLNLLIVLSSPTPRDETEEWLAFDIFEVKRSLLAELAPLELAGMLHIDVEDRPTLDNLRRRIGAQRRGYHLFHYVGHALPDRLILEDRAGRREDPSSSQFMEVLRLCPDLRLAVFAGCETARAAADPAALDTKTAVGWRDLLSLADYCVQEACPTVIGMQAVLPFSTERVFTRFFYQALANGYTTAEALRLARGAIQGDERLGGDLLDWSVPALFVGSSEPGALLPRSATAARPPRRVRWELKLGLRQSTDRFLARELPLRQAVDITAGLAPERVLLITGASGVGKTKLVDRALEELPDSVTHVLYAHLDRLSPEVVKACNSLDAGRWPDLAELTALAPDHALDRLCRIVDELLRSGGAELRRRDPQWASAEWWERLVEDLVQHPFALAIDEIGLLDRVQRGLLEKLIDRWVSEQVRIAWETASRERLLEDLQVLLSTFGESRAACEVPARSNQHGLASLPTELRKYVNRLPERLCAESLHVLGEVLERRMVSLVNDVEMGKDREGAGNAGDHVPPARDAIRSGDVFDALNVLDAVRASLGAALQVLASRRSPARIIITCVDQPRDFLELPADQVFEMRLARLTWPETWRWIRRNLPVLVSYGENYLSRLWSTLGTQLDRWEDLERHVLRERGKAVDLQSLAAQVVPPAPRRSAAAGRPARRGERALRIAVAGPHLAGPRELAEAITRLAIENGIGGRVVLDADEAGALAVLIDEPSPFVGGRRTGTSQAAPAHAERTAKSQEPRSRRRAGKSKPRSDNDGLTDEPVPSGDETPAISVSDILQWLQRVAAKQPDIILLDYGASQRPDEIAEGPERTLLRSLGPLSLLIAAGGNNPDPVCVTTPCAYPEVLGVGPLGDDGKLRKYAEWHPKLRKPDLFMADNLGMSALAAALKPETLSDPMREVGWGSSFSALHAVATAALVWSILPELSPQGVAGLLREASRPIPATDKARGLTMSDAVALARDRVVERTLRAGAVDLQTLAAITGLDVTVLSTTLNSLIKREKVFKLAYGRLERYQLLG